MCVMKTSKKHRARAENTSSTDELMLTPRQIALDKHEVTNAQYAKFITATKYVTVAEQQPNARQFPKVPPEDLKPFSIVFKKPGPKDPVNLRKHEGWWDIIYEANWKHPEGPGST